jgi:hypothetical protein
MWWGRQMILDRCKAASHDSYGIVTRTTLFDESNSTAMSCGSGRNILICSQGNPDWKLKWFPYAQVSAVSQNNASKAFVRHKVESGVTIVARPSRCST